MILQRRHALGKGGVECSIHSGGTNFPGFPPRLRRLGIAESCGILRTFAEPGESAHGEGMESFNSIRRMSLPPSAMEGARDERRNIELLDFIRPAFVNDELPSN